MSNENSKLALVTPSDLSLIETNFLNKNQLEFILTRTPVAYIKQKPGKGGGSWNIVSGGYIKKCLNLMFGWDWDFVVVNDRVLQDQVIVLGKLTVRSNGKELVKMQYGRCDIKYLTKQVEDPGNPNRRIKQKTDQYLDIGNDFKGACTDALKKCAAELGIAADIYNKDEFREVEFADETDPNERQKVKEAEEEFYQGEETSQAPPPPPPAANYQPDFEL